VIEMVAVEAPYLDHDAKERYRRRIKVIKNKSMRSVESRPVDKWDKLDGNLVGVVVELVLSGEG
jgi:hypothetical protein